MTDIHHRRNDRIPPVNEFKCIPGCFVFLAMYYIHTQIGRYTLTEYVAV